MPADISLDEAQRIVEEGLKAGQEQIRTQGDPNAERWARIETALARGAKQEYTPGQRFARMTRAATASNYDQEKTVARLKSWGDDAMVRDCEKYYSERAIQIGSPDGASLAIPEDYSNELIPMLYPYSVMAKLQLRHITMMHGTLNFPRISAATSAYWSPPQANSTKASDPKLGRLQLQEKALTCVTPIPNRLLEMPGLDADQWVMDDTLAAMAYQLDFAFFNGTLDNWQPLGVLNYPQTTIVAMDGSRPGNAVNKFDMSVIGAFDWTWPIRMLAAHANANGTLARPAFVLSIDLWTQLMMATTGSAGFLAWLQSLKDGKLLDVPAYRTVNIPTTGSPGSYVTNGVLLDGMEVFMATVQNMRVRKSDVAAYYDSNGTLQPAMSNNETVTMVVWSGDIGVRQTRSVTVGINIDTTS